MKEKKENVRPELNPLQCERRIPHRKEVRKRIETRGGVVKADGGRKTLPICKRGR